MILSLEKTTSLSNTMLKGKNKMTFPSSKEYHSKKQREKYRNPEQVKVNYFKTEVFILALLHPI